MKRMLYLGLAVFVFACLTMPAWAQKGGHGHSARGASATHAKSSSHASVSAGRSNKGGAVRGTARAEQVQGMNTKADTERGFTEAPGLSKTGQPTARKRPAKGQGAAHGQKGKQHQGGGNDPDESQDNN